MRVPQLTIVEDLIASRGLTGSEAVAIFTNGHELYVEFIATHSCFEITPVNSSTHKSELLRLELELERCAEARTRELMLNGNSCCYVDINPPWSIVISSPTRNLIADLGISGRSFYNLFVKMGTGYAAHGDDVVNVTADHVLHAAGKGFPVGSTISLQTDAYVHVRIPVQKADNDADRYIYYVEDETGVYLEMYNYFFPAKVLIALKDKSLANLIVAPSLRFLGDRMPKIVEFVEPSEWCLSLRVELASQYSTLIPIPDAAMAAARWDRTQRELGDVPWLNDPSRFEHWASLPETMRRKIKRAPVELASYSPPILGDPFGIDID